MPLLWDSFEIVMVGGIDVPTGTISLSLPGTMTNFFAQPRDDWRPDVFGFERDARLTVRPQIVDPSGNAIGFGLQPLSVF